MKIWIDGYEANTPQRLGSSQVAFELIKHLEKLDHKNDYTIFLPNSPLDDLPNERDGWKYQILKPKKLWTKIALPLALYSSKEKPDLFFSPTHYIPRFSPVKRIATIFDLAYFHFPEMFKKGDLWKLTNWTKFSVENADHIITISNFSKHDIMKQYKINKEKITVAYPGYSKEIFCPVGNKDKIREILNKYHVKGDYIIFIGTIQPRKNLIRLIEAFRNIDDLKLVIVGKTAGEGRQGWMYKDTLEVSRKFGVEDKIIFTGFAPTEDLTYLLNGAVAFILPSLWEGFGIPVVDAMACGIPVIVSNVSSLPEVAGSAGILVDPYSVDQITQAVRTITSDKKLRIKYIRSGTEQAKKFSWDKMAKIVLKVFTEVVCKDHHKK